MCGFTGVINGGPLQLSADTVTRMSEAIAHRGPDSSGIWHEENAILAHRRLAIVDLTAAGRQPMASRNGRFVMIFNGEIYNHLDLRRALEAEVRCRWRGHSDSETLLECMVQWGVEKTLLRANGMLSFALWDRSSKRLTLARDRFGEKPLCYAEIGKGIVFASELRCMRFVPQVSSAPDPAVVARYLANWNVPAPHTILPGVKKLQPGSYLTWTAEAGAKIESYWSPAGTYASRSPPRTQDWIALADELEALMQDSVKIRMLSDVPLGALLSGGVDSSLVAALMQKSSSSAIRTFSIGFDDPEFDESEKAASVAQHLGTQHELLRVSDAEALAVAPRLGELYDEPFADASQIPTYLVSALTRKHVTVALTGDGFDELFSGYARYVLTEKAWAKVARLPLRGMMGKALGHMPQFAINAIAGLARPIIPKGVNPASLGRKLRHSGHLLQASGPTSIYDSYMSSWPDPQGLMKESIGPAPGIGWEHCDTAQLHDAFMLHDQMDYLPNDILCKVDRASMAVSLETRIPALDPRVAEFAWRIPPELRWKNGFGKAIAREVLYRHVPRHIIDQPKKGFAVPLDRWLRGPLKTWASDLLSEATLRRQGLLNPSVITKHWQDFLSGGTVTASQMWTVLMLQDWMRYRGA